MDALSKIPSKEVVYKLFEQFIKQRPELDPADYGDGISGYRVYKNDANNIAKNRSVALKELEIFDAFPGMDWGAMEQACKLAFSGRLSIQYVDGKGWYIQYTAGQYYASEYRLAAIAVLSQYNRWMGRNERL